MLGKWKAEDIIPFMATCPETYFILERMVRKKRVYSALSQNPASLSRDDDKAGSLNCYSICTSVVKIKSRILFAHL